jgi:ABC-type nickel/cobalt efflux system permease component RcnA
MPRRAALAVALLGLAAPALPAHPVPKDNHDRTILLRLLPDRLVVDYRLEVDELRAVRDLPEGVARQARDRRHLHRLYLDYFGPVLADNLVVTLDGKPLPLRLIATAQQATDHLRCDYRFEAPWPRGGARRLTFREANWSDDDFSLLRLTVSVAPGVEVEALSAPDEELLARPASERRPGDGERLRRAAATFTPGPPRAEPGEYRPSLPPDPSPAREAPEEEVATWKTGTPGVTACAGRQRGPAADTVSAKPRPARQTDLPPLASPEDDGEKPHERHLLDLLFRSGMGLGLLLLLAALFGAAHALTPGHGKTLVAAYLVGERGTVAHAILLGVVTTLTHTGSVIVLAVLLRWFFPGQAPAGVQAALGLVGGLLIAGMGLWLLMRRLAGQADHVHIGGGHHHHHHHGPAQAAGWWGLVVLGVSGGLVPCWDAILMLVFAISAHQLALALPLLLAFSAGLAGVLVLLGISVVLARNAAVARWGASERLVRLGRALPIFSAAAVLMLGLWLCYDSSHVAGP